LDCLHRLAGAGRNVVQRHAVRIGDELRISLPVVDDVAEHMADAAGGVEKSEALGRGLFARRDLLDICDVRGQAVGPVKRVIARILMNEMIRRQRDCHPGAADQDGQGQHEQRDASAEGDFREIGRGRLLHSLLRNAASRPRTRLKSSRL
jgi:hypothetical protein